MGNSKTIITVDRFQLEGANEPVYEVVVGGQSCPYVTADELASLIAECQKALQG